MVHYFALTLKFVLYFGQDCTTLILLYAVYEIEVAFWHTSPKRHNQYPVQDMTVRSSKNFEEQKSIMYFQTISLAVVSSISEQAPI